MNIIDAVRSGKRIKRMYWANDEWLENDKVIPLKRDDILADDWQVELRMVTITRRQFDAPVLKTSNAGILKG